MFRPGPVLALAVAVVLWGTTFVVSDSALDSFSPAVLTVSRFALALLVLAPLAATRGGVATTLRSAPVALLGATGVAAYYGLQNLGVLTTSAGTAAILQVLLPIATGLIALVWLGERLTRGLVLGLALTTVGVVLGAGQSAAEASWGAALISLGVIAYAVYTVLLRGIPDRDPVVLATATCIWGLIFLLPWLAGEVLLGDVKADVDPAAVGTLLYLGIAASAVTLLLWTYGASRVPASTAGIFTAVIPAVGYLCAIATGEPTSWARSAGCALALLGAGTAARVALKEHDPPPTSPHHDVPADIA